MAKFYSRHESDIFAAHFGIELKDYWYKDTPYLGFDLVKFDDWLRPSHGESVLGCVERKFGKDARLFLRSIVSRVFNPEGKHIAGGEIDSNETDI